jgi:Zn-finger nucleic acid-binding protein
MPAGAYAPPPAHAVPPTAPPAWREAPTQAPVSARLHCPKCHGELVTYERQGVHLEQCRDCRGIWLDRGELDRLIDAEAAPLGRAPGYAPSEPARSNRWDEYDEDDRGRRSRRDDDDDDDDRRRRRDEDQDYPGRRPNRRRSMFGELFEGLIE